MEQVVLTMQNVNYFVKDDIQVLKNINLQFQPNEMVALMGPSGAGKTSLLNVLAARAAGRVEGLVLANNRKVSQGLLMQFANYIPQEDILIAALTPRETLTYTAELRLPASSVSKDDRTNRVNSLLTDLSLEVCADTPVGDATIRGISGGQRKRVSIGQELITNPSVLFVDEPTSGLDSKTADDVIRLLVDIAHRGRTIICSIHQPSKRVFLQFDRLLLLSAGETVYFGATTESVNYFASLGFSLPRHENPPNFFMEALQVPMADTTFAQQWENRHAKYSLPWRSVEAMGDAGGEAVEYTNSFGRQLRVLTARAFELTVRDPRVFTTRLLSTMLATVVICSMYPQLGDEQASAHNQLAFLTISIIYIGSDSCIQQAVVFPLQKMVVIREFNNGSYSLLAYYLSNYVTAMMFQSFYAVLFGAASYIIVHLRFGLDHYFIYQSMHVLIGAFCVGIGAAVGAVSISVMMANLIITPSFVSLVVLNGFAIPRDQLNPLFLPVYLVNPLNYVFKVLAINQLKGRYFPACVALRPSDCPYGEGVIPMERVLLPFSTDPSDLAISAALVVVFTFGVMVGSYFLLWRVVNRTRF